MNYYIIIHNFYLFEIIFFNLKNKILIFYKIIDFKQEKKKRLSNRIYTSHDC